jgi:hypothetical protein
MIMRLIWFIAFLSATFSFLITSMLIHDAKSLTYRREC